MRRALQSSTRNRLLAALSPADFALLQPDLEPVSLDVREVVIPADTDVDYVHFLEGGLGSTVVAQGQAETGMIGHEGMTGVCVLLGSDRTPHATFMQVAGEALRLPIAALRAALDQSSSLRGLLLAYAHVFLIQTGQTAQVNARCLIEQRLARWILMSNDRLGGARVPLTHEFLALMLGVRRPGVTNALHVLEGEGMTRTGRGYVTIVDRQKLLALAGAGYGVPEAEYERLIPLCRPLDRPDLPASRSSGRAG